MMKQNLELSVVAPCYNEVLNLKELVVRLNNVFEYKNISGEIVIVDDGSTDGSRDLLKELGSQYPRLRYFFHDVNGGIEKGWRTGIQQSRGEYICLMDSDLQNLPEDVYRLYREVKHFGSDLVQGVRSQVGRKRDSRFYLSRGLNFLLNTCFSMKLHDNKSGFLLGRREVFFDIVDHRYKYRYFQSMVAVAAKSRGYSIREVETIFEERLMGKSFLSNMPLKVITYTFVDLFKGLFEYRIFPKRENIVSAFLAHNRPTKEDAPLTGWRSMLLKFFFMTMPFHKWMITRRTKYYYEELKKSQYLSLAKTKELQEIKLRRLIKHAYQHVPFYRERLDSLGLKPSDIQTIEDLQKLPFLTKQNVRENLYFDLMSDNHDKNKILKIQTSGSTGEPFVCYADQHQLEIRWAATLRSMEWTGYRFGDRQARLWHQTLGMSFTQVFREKTDALLSRRLFIPAFQMNDESIRLFVNKLKKWKPVLVDGYAESFNFLAYYLKGNQLDGLRPKGIISSAQVLPDQSREIIENSFQCGVFDKYGSREFSGIAYECDAHDGHHVVAENYIVEILKDNRPAKPGEMGEVVITDLNNFCLPFVRYRVGDLAVAMDPEKPCACGRGLPKIGRIEGRVQAIIIGKNGTYLPGTFFAHFFKDFDHIIRQYQVLQDEPGTVTLKIIKALRFEQTKFDEIIADLKKYLGEQTDVKVDFVDSIAMVRTGKHQGSISRLKFDFQQIDQGVETVGQSSKE